MGVLPSVPAMADKAADTIPTRVATVAYGAIAYLAFLASFTYLIGFLADLVVPKGINDGDSDSALISVAVDLVLVSVFAVQHSVMARPWFKRAWTRVVPASVERSTYVLIASAVLTLLLWQWRPLTDEVWSVGPEWARGLLWALFAAGWMIALLSTFLIGHYDMFGLTQVLARWRSRPYQEPAFRVPGLYKLVRHPLYAGFIIAFWAGPDMSAGRLLFAAVATAYILVAIRFEEHDLKAQLGEPYARYADEAPGLVPRPRNSRRPEPARDTLVP
jgi:protein-S-isoprenylcysteine O-methyltransferase Ste14